MYFNSKGADEVTYDAIVVGSGISGGWAAKELCEKGLRTLVLDRGRNVVHGKDYPTANLEVWELENRNRVPQDVIDKHYYKQNRTGYTVKPSHVHFFVKDDEHPYTENKRFDWIRGYHVGGRSLMWGRHSYRLSPLDFEANAKEGIGVDWPVRYEELAPWYDYVERFAGISGQPEGLPHFPDGKYLKPMELNCVEEHVRERFKEHYGDRIITPGRVAHLTEEYEGRGKCRYRDRCMRGCPYGGYFSSNSATLPAAERTGNMTLRPFSIVHSVIYDKELGKAVGVRVIDSETKETHEFYASVIFLNASALASSLILFNSKTDEHPNGLGNGSDQIGRNVMDHHFHAGAYGKIEGWEDKYYTGRRPNGIYLPRFRNLDAASRMKDFVRGYGYQGGASRSGNWWDTVAEAKHAFGEEMMNEIITPGTWQMGINAFGEILPYEDNRVMLNEEVRDMYDMPTLTMDAEIRENELNMRKDMAAQAAEMLEISGFKDVQTFDNSYAIGLGIHEMGTARMGRDPKTSVLNKWNQMHEVPNVYITDGSFMTSASCVNPSLSYMAFTARAADHAVSELKKQNL